MKVVFTRSNPVSPDPRVEKQVLTLCKAGFDVSILAWDRSASNDSCNKIKVGDYVVPIVRANIKADFGGGVRNLRALLWFQVFLVWHLFKKRNEYDVIHAADFDTVLPALLMKTLFRKKLIYDIYDFYVDAFSVPDFAKRFVKWLDFRAINGANAIILTNESRLEQIQGSSPKRVFYIHNSPEDVKLTDRQTIDCHYDISVAYVGVLQDFRLLNEIVDIFSGRPTWKLAIAGFGLLEREIREAAAKYENIIFYGKVSYAEGLDISNAADVLFATYDPRVPNHKYSSPNKLYEAMMLSKPIVVCRNTGVDIIVEDNGIGLVVDYSKSGFESAINEFIGMDEYELFEMGQRARSLYDNRYSWCNMQEVLLGVYGVI